MKILGLSGTPRKGGNAEHLLRAALSPFEEAHWDIELILLSETHIEPCTGCESCAEREDCFHDDGMVRIYRAFTECDALIISSPTYWRNVPAQLKAVFDRTYAARSRHPLQGKAGGAMAVGRGTGAGQAIVLNIIHNFYLSCGALCVPGELNGVSVAADKPGDILSQPRRLAQARTLGENIIRYATLLRQPQ